MRRECGLVKVQTARRAIQTQHETMFAQNQFNRSIGNI